MLKAQKILVTGATGQVARPIAESLAADNEVWCIARFSDPQAREELEALGITTRAWTLGADNATDLPEDFDYVIHAAAGIFEVANDYDAAIRVNAEGTGLLMSHCRRAKAFLHISTMNVYSRVEDNSQVRQVTDALGCHPAYAPSYSISKVATEAVVRTLARQLALPTIICRLGMAYGLHGHGGVPTMLFRAMQAGETIPLPPEGRSWCPLIYERDIVDQVPALLGAASVPATIVNWCGDDHTDEVGLVRYIAQISGFEPQLVTSEDAGYYGGIADVSGRRAITGPCQAGWREGILECLQRSFPRHVFQAPEN